MEYTVRENSRSILERDKTLSSLKKYERMYPWGLCWRTRVENNTVYHFAGSSLGAEIFLEMREYQENGVLK